MKIKAKINYFFPFHLTIKGNIYPYLIPFVMKNSLLLLAFMLIFSSCIKEKDPDDPTQQDQLPPITQTGAYTFGCLLDGEVWVPKHYSNSIVNPPVVLQAYLDETNGNLFQVIANHDRKDVNSPLQILGLFTFTNIVGDTITLPPSEIGPRFVYERLPPQNGGGSLRYIIPRVMRIHGSIYLV